MVSKAGNVGKGCSDRLANARALLNRSSVTQKYRLCKVRLYDCHKNNDYHQQGWYFIPDPVALRAVGHFVILKGPAGA